MKRRFDGFEDWAVVVVDARKFLHFHGFDYGFVIPPLQQWPEDTANGIRDFLRPGSAIEMPIAAISIRRTRRFWGLLKSQETPVVKFINGRHRSRYLFEAGAKVFPIEVECHLVELMRQHCGA